jgi:hypothetical protein
MWAWRSLGCQTNTLGGIIDPDAKRPTSLGDEVQIPRLRSG